MKKLTLNKETIANLNKDAMGRINGGDEIGDTDWFSCMTNCRTCIWTLCDQNTCAYTCRCQ